ncbi:hypothetical protein [Helicobacter sp. T3_23-1059]
MLKESNFFNIFTNLSYPFCHCEKLARLRGNPFVDLINCHDSLRESRNDGYFCHFEP